jgi:hypothetical protein
LTRFARTLPWSGGFRVRAGMDGDAVSHCLLLALVIPFVALTSAGCGETSSSSERESDADPSDSRDALTENRVTWDKDGVIDPRYGISGYWYAFNDCPPNPNGVKCTQPDDALVGPDHEPGWSTSPERVCMKGIAPRVEGDYDLQWGAGMGFFVGGTRSYDATGRGVIGFMFDVTQGTADAAPAPPTLRISFDTPSTADEAHHSITIALPALDQPVIFSELEQGSWVVDPRPFTAEAITTVGFDVYTNDQAPKLYDFCVSNFRVLCERPRCEALK